MKKIDLDDVISNVSDKYLEEAANFSRKKNVGVRFLAIAACLAILVTSIPLTLLMNKNDSNNVLGDPVSTTKDQNDDNTTDPEPIPVIYCDTEVMSLEELQQNVFKDKEVKIEEFVGLQYRHLPVPDKHIVIDRTSDIPENISFKVGGKEFIGIFDTAYTTETNTTNEALKALTKFAGYKIEGTPSGYVIYCVASKTIVHIKGLNDGIPDGMSEKDYRNALNSGNLKPPSEEEIGKIALDDIKSLYGEKIASYFSVNNITTLKNARSFLVSLGVYIGDYRIGQNITLSYSWAGEMYSMLSEKLGVIFYLASQVNETILSKVEKEVLPLIGDKLVSAKAVTIHADGYLCVWYKLNIGLDELGFPKTAPIIYRIK